MRRSAWCGLLGMLRSCVRAFGAARSLPHGDCWSSSAIHRLPGATGSTTVGVTIDVPPSLRKARTAAGEIVWLDALPELASEMASQWSLAIGRSCDGFGMNALVVEATTEDGFAAVVKLAPPGDAAKLALEATVLRLADGDGCV